MSTNFPTRPFMSRPSDFFPIWMIALGNLYLDILLHSDASHFGKAECGLMWVYMIFVVPFVQPIVSRMKLISFAVIILSSLFF